MLDMGNLTICNIFKKLQVETESEEYPIVDEMKIELQNLKLLRYNSLSKVYIF